MALIDLIKSQLGNQFISESATQLGESESNVSKAIGGFLPAVLGGLADNSQKTDVLDAIKNMGTGEDNSTVSSVISSIFGDKLNGVLNLVSGYSKVSPSSASSLLNSVTGVTLGSVGKYAAENNMDASGISNLLTEQKGLISSLLPAGFSLASLGGLFDGAKEGLASAAGKISGSVSDVKKDISAAMPNLPKPNNGGSSFWKWLLPLILLGVAAWFLWKQCYKKEDAAKNEADTTSVAKDSANAIKDSAMVSTKKVSTDVVLPSGKTLKAFKGGVEDQLVQFLKSDEYKNATDEQLKQKWFNFDNLNFEFGTTKITAASQAQVDNLKAILAEFPTAKFKIGAYTDKVGDEKANEALSQKRADAVKTAVGSAQIVEAKGFGEQFAQIDEKASDKEREADRKTAIRITK